MRILSDGFVRAWEGKLINIHPSLLPAYKGTRVHERVIAAGETQSGASVHFVVPELDAGPVIAQASVPVHPDDSPETLAARVLEVEHKLYPAALRLLAEDKVKLEKGLAVFSLAEDRQILAETSHSFFGILRHCAPRRSASSTLHL